MTKWSVPIKLAAEVINDAIHCGLDCTSVQTPRWSRSAAEDTDAGRPDSRRQIQRPIKLTQDFPRNRLQHPKLFRRLIEVNEPVAADSSVSSESTIAPPKSNGMWQSSEGKCSAQSSTAFRDSLTLREDSEIAAETETDRKPCVETELKVKSRHRRQRTVEDDDTTDLQDTKHHHGEENLPDLLRTLNRYIKKAEKQRQHVAQLKRENETYREIVAMTELRILQNLEGIDELKSRFRRMEDFARRRQGELINLNDKHKHMDHDFLIMEELLARQKQALLMLKAHVLRVYHADASSGSGETTLQNLCVAVMQILSEVNEF